MANYAVIEIKVTHWIKKDPTYEGDVGLSCHFVVVDVLFLLFFLGFFVIILSFVPLFITWQYFCNSYILFVLLFVLVCSLVFWHFFPFHLVSIYFNGCLFFQSI